MNEQDIQKQLNNQINDELREHREILASHTQHLGVANREMGEVKIDIGIVKNDVGWIKKTFGDFKNSLDKMDSRNWWILGSVAVGIAAQILIALLRK